MLTSWRQACVSVDSMDVMGGSKKCVERREIVGCGHLLSHCCEVWELQQRSSVSEFLCFSMALRDVTNTTGGYIPQIHMDAKYLPLVRRGTRIDYHATRSSFARRRARGKTHIDLWTDGALYPEDPATKCAPEFRNLKQILQFICHGDDGLLGYTRRLRDRVPACGGVDQVHTTVALENCIVSLERELARQEQISIRLQADRDQLHAQAQMMASAAALDAQERQQLHHDVGRLESECAELRATVAENRVLLATLADQQERLVVIEEELAVTTTKYTKLEEKLKRMVETPAGLRERVHGRIMKNITDLRSGTGYFKRRRTQLRHQILPEVLHRVQKSNKQLGKKKRLGGEGSSQAKTAAVIASILSQGEAKALAEQPQMSQATMAVTQSVFKKIQDVLTKEVMLGTIDGSSVTHRGYTEIYKTMKNRIGLVAPGLRGSVLPSPYKLAGLRKQMNENLPQFIGDYYNIEGRRHVPEVRQGKRIVRPAKEVILDSKNNLFAELEVVQRSMVLFYDITVEGSDRWPPRSRDRLIDSMLCHSRVLVSLI